MTCSWARRCDPRATGWRSTPWAATTPSTPAYLGLSQGNYTTTDLVALTLDAGEGNNRIIGSPFNDVLKAGAGNDTFTGGPGLDTFTDTGGSNTLIETNDADVFLSNDKFVVGQIIGDNGGAFAPQAMLTEPQLEDTVNNQDDPNLTFPNRGGRFANGAIVEDLNGQFQTVLLQGGPGNNVMVVNGPATCWWPTGGRSRPRRSAARSRSIIRAGRGPSTT